MAITFVGAGTFTEKGATGTTLNLPLPAGTAAGDAITAFYAANSATVIGTQTGLTTLISQSSTGNTLVPGAYIGAKIATSTDVSNGFVTLNSIPAAAGSGQALGWRGFDTGTAPFTQDFAAYFLDKTSTATANFDFLTRTTTVPGVALCYIAINNGTTGPATPPTTPAAFTEDGDRVTGRNIEVAHLIWSGSGATGTMTAAMNGTTRGVGLMIGIRPAAVAAAPLALGLRV